LLLKLAARGRIPTLAGVEELVAHSQLFPAGAAKGIPGGSPDVIEHRGESFEAVASGADY
jgi:hypothetical protein